MRLFYSPNSPYARFARLVLRHHGLLHRVEEVKLHPFDNPGELLKANPLGKVPTLLLNDGTPLFDSEVIALYFDRSLGDGSLSSDLQDDWGRRVEFSLAKGLIDTAVMLRGEKWRDSQDGERSSPFFAARFTAAIQRGLARLEQAADDGPCAHASFVDLIQGVAVGYIDFRHPEVGIATGFPKLHARHLQRPGQAFNETEPEG